MCFWKCGKERSYRHNFWMCGKYKGYGWMEILRLAVLAQDSHPCRMLGHGRDFWKCGKEKTQWPLAESARDKRVARKEAND